MRTVLAVGVLLGAITCGTTGAAAPAVSFELEDRQVRILIGGRPFANYVFKDDRIRRPFFAQVHAPDGVQVTRTHPPVSGKDATDHDTMHPGIWLAFGELGGSDFWRNKGTVRHEAFTEKPKGAPGVGSFAVRNRYESGGKTIAEEVCRIVVQVREAGTLLVWESIFRGPEDFAFGDQEEMGFGVRVATALTVRAGGTIVNSDGMKNERQVWGKAADWCAYGGKVEGKPTGVVLMPDPTNFRRSWFHARDYGLLVANPFGRNAFTRAEKSRVVVKKGETFRLRFGVLVHSGAVDAAGEYRAFTSGRSAP